MKQWCPLYVFLYSYETNVGLSWIIFLRQTHCNWTIYAVFHSLPGITEKYVCPRLLHRYNSLGMGSPYIQYIPRNMHTVFIRPFEKRSYYAMAMSVRPSVRLSVCPSVRPSAFSGLFFNMLWDINLKLGIYIQWVARHVEFQLHHNWVTLT